MNLQRCEKGHFYDGDKFPSCPHCNVKEGERDVTIGMDIPKNETQTDDDNFTRKLTQQPASENKLSLAQAVNMAQGNQDEDDDMGKTVRFYDSTGKGIEPVVGWLVGLNGSAYGQSFLLKQGRNFIGRGSDMDVSLSGDNSVSRNKHAIVVYEPKSKMFIAQPGESRELFYINEEVVLNNYQLKKNDVLLIGETRLMFIPCCDEQFCWEDIKDE